jgi:Eukaryotic aspartyl protease
MLGLGFPETSQFNATPVFHTMIEQKVVEKPVWGLKMAETGSELVLGGVNHSMYTGPVHYSPLTAKVCEAQSATAVKLLIHCFTGYMAN